MVVAIIGAGAMAVEHYRALTELGIPVRVHGRGADSARLFAEKVGCAPAIGALEDQLTEYGVPEMAIVAVPVAQLSPVTRQLLDAGCRRILVEKPGGLNPEEVERLAAHSRADRVFVAYNRRFLPSTRCALSMIEEDGGATSLRFEFTELADRVGASNHPKAVKRNWFFANSTHVVDLAFFLAGEKGNLDRLRLEAALVSGSLDWHPDGARFAGVGWIDSRTPFAYSADWSSAGRWGVEINTMHRRIILQPLERLSFQPKDSFDLIEVPLLAEASKPGLRSMLEAFLADVPPLDLLSLHDQAARLSFFEKMIRPSE